MSTPTKFGSTSTADEVAAVFVTEIMGKNVLITGTSLNGIGFETARAISKYANLVIITGYNAERLQLSEDAIKKDVPTANIRQLILDLSSLDGVRKASETVNAYSEPLHILIHNAAASIAPFRLTVDNLENQLATAHVGPFLFTKLLAPKLLASATENFTPRVVLVSSLGFTMGAGVDFEYLAHPDEGKYTPSDVYIQAKSANVLMAIAISTRSKGKINAYSLHPGVILTNLAQKEEAVTSLQALGVLGPDGLPDRKNLEWKTLPQGAATTVVAAFDPGLNVTPGVFLDDCAVWPFPIAAHSSEPVNLEKLWTITEEIIGEKFTF
ncbi:NAD-P-binding protein [Mycena crocata]|nr:NAD-P-binding protein [Mycena crocata]